jgi:hypothetical protein
VAFRKIKIYVNDGCGTGRYGVGRITLLLGTARDRLAFCVTQ